MRPPVLKVVICAGMLAASVVFGLSAQTPQTPPAAPPGQEKPTFTMRIDLITNDVIVPGLTFTPGTLYDVHAQVTGTNPTTIRARVWRDGTAPTKPTDAASARRGTTPWLNG